MEEWDKERWQGKRKNQVEYSEQVGLLSFILLIILLIILILIELM